MKGLEDTTFLLMCSISNAVGLLLLSVAWKRPRIARVLFFLLFSAFPFSLIASAALYFILRNPANDYLWINNNSKAVWQ
jgi:hypothetical protein